MDRRPRPDYEVSPLDWPGVAAALRVVAVRSFWCVPWVWTIAPSAPLQSFRNVPSIRKLIVVCKTRINNQDEANSTVPRTCCHQNALALFILLFRWRTALYSNRLPGDIFIGHRWADVIIKAVHIKSFFFFFYCRVMNSLWTTCVYISIDSSMFFGPLICKWLDMFDFWFLFPNAILHPTFFDYVLIYIAQRFLLLRKPIYLIIIFRAYMHPKSNKTCIAFLYAPRGCLVDREAAKVPFQSIALIAFLYIQKDAPDYKTRGRTAENIVQEELLRCQQKTCNFWRIRKTYSVEERKIRGDQSAASIYI